ncbi:MAG: Omp28-related outer membrane protein [Hyphomicrobiales bacterium]
MIKNLLLSVLLLISYSSFSQSIVSTEVSKKKILIEEFTGINSEYCPEGHAMSKLLMEKHPDTVYTIAIHAGTYANPKAEQPDYRTPFGDAFVTEYDVDSYPSAVINRTLFSGEEAMPLSVSKWEDKAEEVLSQDAPVNIGIETIYDPITRNFKVKLEAYYTADVDETDNFIHVALVQDNIVGLQNAIGPKYVHMHMLRHLITGQWGEKISGMSEGTLIEKSYNYALPDSINGIPLLPQKCKIIAFISKDKKTVYNCEAADVCELDAEITLDSDNVAFLNIDQEYFFDYTITHKKYQPAQYLVTLDTIECPETWTSCLYKDEDAGLGLQLYLMQDLPFDFKMRIKPDCKGVARFKLNIEGIDGAKLLDEPQEVVIYAGYESVMMYATSTDIPATVNDIYKASLDKKCKDDYAVITPRDLESSSDKETYKNINNIFFNVSTASRFMTPSQIEILMDCVDNGANLFISGQDIGWDINDSKGHSGGSEFKTFYKDYLKAKFISDGDESTKVTAKAINAYRSMGESPLENCFEGSKYNLDQIEALEDAVTTFYYDDDTAKVAGVAHKKDNSYISYIAFNLEYLSNSTHRDNMISLTKDFFDGKLGVEEYSGMMKNLLAIYPNPASNYTTLKGLTEDVSWIKIFDVQGKLVQTIDVNSLNNELRIDVSNLTSGLYQIVTDSGLEKKFIKK